MPRSARIRRKSPRGAAPDQPRASTADAQTRFSDALSLLAVAHGSLAAKELAGTSDEEVAIRHALEPLKTVYSDLDRPTSPTRHR